MLQLRDLFIWRAWGCWPISSCCNPAQAVAILVLFQQFLGKFFAPKSECFTKYDDAFCSYIFNYACSRHKAYCYWKGSKLWKNCIYSSKTYLKKADRGMHPSHPPLDLPTSPWIWWGDASAHIPPWIRPCSAIIEKSCYFFMLYSPLTNARYKEIIKHTKNYAEVIELKLKWKSHVWKC